MGTCVGCGSPLAPAWKFCVHCGIAIEPPAQPEIPGAIRSSSATTTNARLRNRLFILGGIGIFLVGIALLVFAISIFSGALH